LTHIPSLHSHILRCRTTKSITPPSACPTSVFIPSSPDPRHLHSFPTRRSSDLFLRRFRRDHSGTIEADPAVMTVNALGLVFVPTLGANQFDHAVGHFFGLLSAVTVAAAGAVFASAFLPATGFSVLAAGTSFLAASF